MANRLLVTIVGATGAQGGAVVKSLVETGKYKIRGLTRDPTSGKSQALKRLSDDIELVKCDISNRDDVQRAFKDSWAVFTVTDYWAQPDKPEVEIEQGAMMADVAAALKISYYIASVLEDVDKQSDGKLPVLHFTGKAKIRDYIKEKYPDLKTIYVEPGMYMQNWHTFGKPQKLDDGTRVFSFPIDGKAKLHLADIDDMGPIVREILENPDKFVGQDVCICGEEIKFEDMTKIFTKVTGIPAVCKPLSEEEYRASQQGVPKIVVDDLFYMFKWFEQYGYFGKNKDWKNGQKLTKLTTWEDWLKKTGWKGE